MIWLILLSGELPFYSSACGLNTDSVGAIGGYREGCHAIEVLVGNGGAGGLVTYGNVRESIRVCTCCNSVFILCGTESVRVWTTTSFVVFVVVQRTKDNDFCQDNFGFPDTPLGREVANAQQANG